VRLFADFETRSRLPIADVGAYRYAEDDSTAVLCLALSDGVENWLWMPEQFRPLADRATLTDDELAELIGAATEIHAHNAGFERAIWAEIMVRRHGFAPVPLETWRCTAAKAAAMNLPRGLDDACGAIGLPGKDSAGYAVMMKMCKPIATNRRGAGGWYESREDFAALLSYCANDVAVEMALDRELPDLSPVELEVWRCTERMNDRGVAVDLESIRQILETVETHKEALAREMHAITHGMVAGPSRLADLLTWLQVRGVELPDTKRKTLEREVERVGDPVARRAIQIRLSASKATSCAKYDAILRSVCRDGRIRGMFVYCGAQATGRWAARLVQLQNLPRGGMKYAQVEQAIGAFELGLCAGDPLDVASSCIRSMFVAGE
jgi:DNA polymerase